MLLCADAESGPLPFAMTFAISASLIPCTAALRKSGMLFFFPTGVLPLASVPWHAVHWALKMPCPVVTSDAFEADAAGFDSAGAEAFGSGDEEAIGGGGGFFGRFSAPDCVTVSVTTGPPLFLRFSVDVDGLTTGTVVAVTAVEELEVPVVSVDIDPVTAVVSVSGAVVAAVAVVSATVEVVSLLLVVLTVSLCLQPSVAIRSTAHKTGLFLMEHPRVPLSTILAEADRTMRP